MLVFRNADAGIPDLDPNRITEVAGTDKDFTFFRISDRVGHQVLHDAPQIGGITGNAGLGGHDPQVQPFGVGGRAEGIAKLAEHVPQRHSRDMNRRAA